MDTDKQIGKNKHQVFELPESFGELLRYYRKRTSLTQLQLYFKLIEYDFVVSESTISMWETGRRLPDDWSVFHYLGQCLSLTEDEEQALLLSCFMEKILRDIEPYAELKKEMNDRVSSIRDSLLTFLTHAFDTDEDVRK